jgi:hypothetical protein
VRFRQLMHFYTAACLLLQIAGGGVWRGAGAGTWGKLPGWALDVPTVGSVEWFR